MSEFWRSSAVRHLETRRSSQELSCYRPHTHDAFSLGLVDAGSSVLTGSLGGGVRLLAGDVVVIPAGHVHDCNPDDGAWRYRMTHADQDWVASLVTRGVSDELFSRIGVVRRPALFELAGRWTDLVISDAPAWRIEDGLDELLGALADATPEHEVPGRADPDLLVRLAPVLHRLRHDESNPALGDLAELVGMTRPQLVRAVKRATGLAPLAWRQNARVAVARRMLRDGTPIAETAAVLGFADQSHLHRVFRAHVATSPGTYRG
ncbi:AraC family transcriptional regulator [Pseudokineococcus sp. 1T1Z-3]|uniref:AraC family transcriptional regulator n=1 Tax=Pseudokineococcus sp. 1T1Z-3 TaxID=3132745 RepID=UPI0030AC6222